MPTLENLRKKHPKFIFESYSWKISKNSSADDSDSESNSNLAITFQYKIEPDISFSPTLIIKNVSQETIEALGKEKVDSYVFNIGLAEMFSYWKVTASPIIEIKAGKLDQDQINWWHKLLIKGMGEYFFVNNIDFTASDFVKIVSNSDKIHLASNKAPATTQDHNNAQIDNSNNNKNKILIPIGGGKDSAVTLEILGNLSSPNSTANQTSFATFTVNPTQAALDTISVKKVKNKVEIVRTIDPKLIELNNQSYLNGHVPISAFFAFLSVFSAEIFGYNYVAISNERSSNEGNVQFCNQEINHQYSKTYEFEKDFQNYTEQYLPKNTPFYFSFLRPLYELQIAKIFAGKVIDMDKYHPIFRSCNRGQKTNVWCGKCSKCLFAYAIIFPFMENQKIHSYFGKDMFADESLWPIAQELLGAGNKKPLECVGTHEETTAAFYLSAKKYLDSKQDLPALLKRVNEEIISGENDLENRSQAILNAWNENNSIPDKLQEVLKRYV